VLLPVVVVIVEPPEVMVATRGEVVIAEELAPVPDPDAELEPPDGVTPGVS